MSTRASKGTRSVLTPQNAFEEVIGVNRFYETTMTPEMEASLRAAEELLELNSLLSKISEVDLEKVSTASENLLRKLDSFDIVKARTPSKAKPKKGRSGAEHWRAREKRKKEARRRHYVNEKKKRKYEWMEIFEHAKASGDEAGAWYKWLGRESTRMAHKKRKGWVVTEEEFREHIFPSLLDGEGKPRIPVMQRYDKDGLWELGNMYLTVEGKTVFCGKEHVMRQLGYIL